MKNRKREICTSGSARDEDGQPPHLLGRRNFLHLAAGAAALPAISRIAWGQTYPTKPVTLIVPFSAGGSPDVVARILSPRLSELLGQQVIVENVGGAAGMNGVSRVAKAAPDGYQLVLGTLVPSP
jgi:tripartite-type tricarboxylate transporter receptor subunit TctC